MWWRVLVSGICSLKPEPNWARCFMMQPGIGSVANRAFPLQKFI